MGICTLTVLAPMHGRGPELNQKEKVSWALVLISRCFLTVDAMCPAGSCSGDHNVSDMLGSLYLKLGDRINLFFLKLLFVSEKQPIEFI